MTNLIRIATILGMALTAGTAHAAFQNRADCYAAVIASCNTKAHPEACINNGLPQCDAEFEEYTPPARKPALRIN